MWEASKGSGYIDLEPFDLGLLLAIPPTDRFPGLRVLRLPLGPVGAGLLSP